MGSHPVPLQRGPQAEVWRSDKREDFLYRGTGLRNVTSMSHKYVNLTLFLTLEHPKGVSKRHNQQMAVIETECKN